MTIATPVPDDRLHDACMRTARLAVRIAGVEGVEVALSEAAEPVLVRAGDATAPVLAEIALAPSIGRGRLVARGPGRAGAEAETRQLLEELARGLEAQLELAQSESQLRELLAQASDGFMVLSDDGTVQQVNERICAMLLYSEAELLGKHVTDLMAPGELARAPLQLERLRADGTTLTERAWLRKDGGRIEVEINAVRLRDGRFQGIIRDVGERRELDARMRRHARFRSGLIALVEESLQRGLDEGFYQHLLERAIEVIPGAQGGSLMLRAPAEDGGREDRYRFVAAAPYDLEVLRTTYLLENELHRGEGDGPVLLRDFQTLDAAAIPLERREPMYASGPTEAIEVSLSVPVTLDGRPAAILTLDNFDDGDAFDEDAQDMAQLFAQQVAALLRRFRLEENLERLAYFDPLTGLANRRLLRERLEGALAEARRGGDDVALLFLDLDDFKLINDLHGHPIGDLVLEEVAERICGRLREADVLARWGGDEFVVLLPRVAGPEGAADLAARLRSLFRSPLRIEGHELPVTVSIGIDLDRSGSRRDADALIHNASTALNRAKDEGRDAFRFYTEEMNARIEERHRLETRLRRALQDRVIVPHFQPRVSLASGRIEAVEALARWHDEGAFVSPGRFIPLAEETGLIHALGLQMLDRSVAQARAWLDAGHRIRVAVNLSARQLQRPDVVEAVAEVLARHGLPPELLELEITESTAMTDVEDSLARLEALRELGVCLAIDDFGTAYSSLAYLHRLPVQALKIDRAFVERVDADGPDSSLPVVQAIVALAKSLRLQVVAEGVETESQLRTLRAVGCDEAQGFLLGRPVAADGVSLERCAA